MSSRECSPPRVVNVPEIVLFSNTAGRKAELDSNITMILERGEAPPRSSRHSEESSSLQRIKCLEGCPATACRSYQKLANRLA